MPLRFLRGYGTLLGVELLRGQPGLLHLLGAAVDPLHPPQHFCIARAALQSAVERPQSAIDSAVAQGLHEGRHLEVRLGQDVGQ